MGVSTHSRPKAAAVPLPHGFFFFGVSTHSRPKAAVPAYLPRRNRAWFQHTAARRRLQPHRLSICGGERFNTQPPEGGCDLPTAMLDIAYVSTHSRPKAAARAVAVAYLTRAFQHTAARRRLVLTSVWYSSLVSFNTQPPEGGCCPIIASK